jgi:hypothetical protein
MIYFLLFLAERQYVPSYGLHELSEISEFAQDTAGYWQGSIGAEGQFGELTFLCSAEDFIDIVA